MDTGYVLSKGISVVKIPCCKNETSEQNNLLAQVDQMDIFECALATKCDSTCAIIDRIPTIAINAAIAAGEKLIT